MNRVDTTRWKLKVRRIEGYMASSIPILVKKLIDEVHKETIKNLSGPQIKPGIPGYADDRIGESPVPRRTSMLAHSIKREKMTDVLMRIYSDPKVAPYGKYVHDGTRKMKPRRFLKDAIEKVKSKNWKEIKATFMDGLQKRGRA